MSNLGQVIRNVQRDAAGMFAEELREQIEYGVCCPLDEALNRVQAIRPGITPDMDNIDAVADLMTAVLVIALYVRELNHRPVVWTEVSPN